MIANVKTNNAEIDMINFVKWQGRSGRFYSLVQESLDDFILMEHDLYVIAKGDKPHWIGTAGDLIFDQKSRAKFREAVKIGSSVLRLRGDECEIKSRQTAWDIAGGHLDKNEKISSIH